MDPKKKLKYSLIFSLLIFFTACSSLKESNRKMIELESKVVKEYQIDDSTIYIIEGENGRYISKYRYSEGYHHIIEIAFSTPIYHIDKKRKECFGGPNASVLINCELLKNDSDLNKYILEFSK